MMAKPDVITMSTLSMAGATIAGWIFATTHFMVRADAEKIHEAFSNDVRKTYLELKIDAKKTDMVFIEEGGVSSEERRDYELLQFGVERMTGLLMDLQ